MNKYVRIIIRYFLRGKISIRRFRKYIILFPSDQFLDLYFGKSYESHIHENLKEFVNLQDHLLLDIGSNIGQFALNIKSVFPNTKIICYEPGLEAFNFLKSNILINNLDIKCVNAAVVGKSSKYHLIEDNVTGGRTSFIGEENENSDHKRVKNLCVLKDEIRSTNPTLIKLDVEGFEWEIIKHTPINSLKTAYLIIELRTQTIEPVYAYLNNTHLIYDLMTMKELKTKYDLIDFKFSDILFIPKMKVQQISIK
jgi:FkbM family methyltransferase